jgi:hypothetical protein
MLGMISCLQYASNVLVRLVDIVDGQDGQVSVISRVPECDSGSSLDAKLVDHLSRHIKGNRHRKENAGREPVLPHNAVLWRKQSFLAAIA